MSLTLQTSFGSKNAQLLWVAFTSVKKYFWLPRCYKIHHYWRWDLAYELETTDQSTEYRVKGEQEKTTWHTNIKVMLTVYFDHRGVEHYKFLPSVKQIKRNIIWVLCVVCCCYSPEKVGIWTDNYLFLYHDTAPAPHICQLFRQEFNSCRFATIVFTWFITEWLRTIP